MSVSSSVDLPRLRGPKQAYLSRKGESIELFVSTMVNELIRSEAEDPEAHVLTMLQQRRALPPISGTLPVPIPTTQPLQQQLDAVSGELSKAPADVLSKLAAAFAREEASSHTKLPVRGPATQPLQQQLDVVSGELSKPQAEVSVAAAAAEAAGRAAREAAEREAAAAEQEYKRVLAARGAEAADALAALRAETEAAARRAAAEAAAVAAMHAEELRREAERGRAAALVAAADAQQAAEARAVQREHTLHEQARAAADAADAARAALQWALQWAAERAGLEGVAAARLEPAEAAKAQAEDLLRREAAAAAELAQGEARALKDEASLQARHAATREEEASVSEIQSGGSSGPCSANASTQPASKDAASYGWSTAGWARSIDGIPEAIAISLMPLATQASPNELAAVRALGQRLASVEDVADHLLRSGIVNALAEALLPALAELNSAQACYPVNAHTHMHMLCTCTHTHACAQHPEVATPRLPCIAATARR